MRQALARAPVVGGNGWQGRTGLGQEPGNEVGWRRKVTAGPAPVHKWTRSRLHTQPGAGAHSRAHNSITIALFLCTAAPPVECRAQKSANALSWLELAWAHCHCAQSTEERVLRLKGTDALFQIAVHGQDMVKCSQATGRPWQWYSCR